MVDTVESQSAGQRSHLRDELAESPEVQWRWIQGPAPGTETPHAQVLGVLAPGELGVLTDTTLNMCQRCDSYRNESQLCAGLPGGD